MKIDQEANNLPKKRRYKEKNSKKKRKILFIIIIFILLFFIFRTLEKQIITPTLKANDPLSFLLVGSDVNEYREERYGGTKPEKTDSLMVVTFNPSTYRFVLTSIPRDTAIDYSCKDMRGKVNEIYAASGQDMSCLTSSISNFLNVPIDYYIKVNMDQLKMIIDQEGPLTITAHAKDGYLIQENVDLTNTYEWYDGQTYKMDSDEALTYARARHDSEVDYGRGIRQQQVLVTLASNMLDKGITIDLIKNLFTMVDTDMPTLLLKKYVDYVKEIQNIYISITNGNILDEKSMNDTAWRNMKKYFDYSGDINSFQDYLKKNYSKIEIQQYFIQGYQFYNETYNGFYITPYDQLYEVSNALRENLGLKEEEPNTLEKPFGINDFGAETLAGESSTTYTDTYTPNEVGEEIVQNTVQEDVSQNEEQDLGEDSNLDLSENNEDTDSKNPETSDDIDTDGDGISDLEEIEMGTDPNLVDTDGDGISDLEDSDPLTPQDVQGGDIDGDGLNDLEEIELGTDMYNKDTDGDGVNDLEDQKPLDPNE